MKLKTSEITRVVDAVKLYLEEDLASYDVLLALLEESCSGLEVRWLHIEELLRVILRRDVEIGNAIYGDGSYVKFVAWVGTVEEKLKRAKREIEACSERDRGFAFWLCLRANVDEFEKGI